MTGKANFKGYTWAEQQNTFRPEEESLNNSIDPLPLCIETSW